MASSTDPEVHLTDRAEWRSWLEANHATRSEVWLVSWKKATGRPSIPYPDAVEEALCFGWADGRPDTVDAERAKRRFGRRKPGSAWSAVNKQRAERLISTGLMAPAGQAAVDRARADGSWSTLDAVEAMAVPDDLAAAFDDQPGAAATFAAYPNFLRRDILEWITAAKRDETRAGRIARTAQAIAEGRVVSHARAARTTR